MLDLEELLATRLLVQGNSGSGKSHLLRRLLEQSAPHVQQVVVDPEGDFVGLAERFGHVVIDGDRSVAELETIALPGKATAKRPAPKKTATRGATARTATPKKVKRKQAAPKKTAQKSRRKAR